MDVNTCWYRATMCSSAVAYKQYRSLWQPRVSWIGLWCRWGLSLYIEAKSVWSDLTAMCWNRILLRSILQYKSLFVCYCLVLLHLSHLKCLQKVWNINLEVIPCLGHWQWFVPFVAVYVNLVQNGSLSKLWRWKHRLKMWTR